MSGELMDRNPYEIMKFANELEAYCMEMKIACKKLQNNLEDAKPGMKDELSTQALLRSEQAIEELLNSLPADEQMVLTLKKIATPLIEGNNIRLGR